MSNTPKPLPPGNYTVKFDAVFDAILPTKKGTKRGLVQMMTVVSGPTDAQLKEDDPVHLKRFYKRR